MFSTVGRVDANTSGLMERKAGSLQNKPGRGNARPSSRKNIFVAAWLRHKQWKIATKHHLANEYQRAIIRVGQWRNMFFVSVPYVTQTSDSKP